MSTDFIKTSFAGGEFAPSLAGRVNFEKYDTAAAVMRNFFVDFRGGASTRPGTSHVGACRIVADLPKPRLIPFVFNADQSYVLELNNDRMRVVFRGAYVTEPNRLISSVTRGATTTISMVSPHGYSVDDFVVVSGVSGVLRTNGISGLNGRTFRVASTPTANSFTIEQSGPTGGPTYTSINSVSWTAYTSGGLVARIYERTTPWIGSALFALNFTQSADVLTVVHPDYPAYDIRRIAQDDWQIVQRTYGSTLSAPTGAAATAVNNDGSAPQYFYAYIVTTVDQNGRESVPTAAITVVNRALDQNSSPNVVNRIVWSAVAGAYKYRVYKATPVPDGLQGGGPYFYGLVGNTFEPLFVDVNFAIEFDQGPPQGRNPFLDKALAAAVITAPGQGYVSPYLTITDASGTGGVVSLGSDQSVTASPYGELNVANVVAGGTNYTAPIATVFDAAPLGSGLVLAFSGAWVANPLGTGFNPAPGSITISSRGSNYHQGSYSNFVRAVAGNQVGSNVLQIDVTAVSNGQVASIGWANADVTPSPTTGMSSTGAGDTLTFTIIGTDTPASGGAVTLTLGGTTNPSCVAYFEQRMVFAGSRANPATFWMSRPGQFNNFDVSDPVQDDDAITASLFAQEVNIINALVPVTDGLIALTTGGAYLITGGANDAPTTPSTVRAPPQAFSGAQPLAPLRINDNILYAQARGSGVRDLAFNFYSNSFTGTDVSVLSGHLLEDRRITQWCYAEEPNKLVWAVRDDGVLLSLTYLKDQQVYGWARHDTSGQFVSVCSIPEDREDAVYVVVSRYLPGYGFRYHTERMASRNFGANPAANIPARAEEAWCVDDGAEYPLTEPNTAISYGEVQDVGILYEVTIVSGGSDYSGTLVVEIADLEGSGGEIAVTQSGGVINSAAITLPGQNYIGPAVTVRGSGGGSGAVLSVRVVTTMLIVTEGSPFASGDVGETLRVRGGRGTVLSVPTTNSVLVDFTDALPAGLANAAGVVLPRIAAGDWSLTAPVSTIGGLDHLNGSVVQVLADGSVQLPKTVVDGCITLDNPATRIIVGQGFTAQLQTMRMEIAQPTSQGARKQISSMHIRVKDTRGLFAGSTWTDLIEVKERNHEPPAQPITFQTGGGLSLDPAYDNAPSAPHPLWYADKFVIMDGGWDDDGVVCMQQSYPLPATVLAVIPAFLEGDK